MSGLVLFCAFFVVCHYSAKHSKASKSTLKTNLSETKNISFFESAEVKDGKRFPQAEPGTYVVPPKSHRTYTTNTHYTNTHLHLWDISALAYQTQLRTETRDTVGSLRVGRHFVLHSDYSHNNVIYSTSSHARVSK